MIKESQIDLLKIQRHFENCVASARDAADSIFSGTDDNGVELQTLKSLFALMSARSQAAYYLVTSGYIWDAEIILRSFSEASSKIWFICYRNEDSRASLVAEFWDEYAQAHNNKKSARSKKAQLLALQYGSTTEHEIFSFLSRQDVFPHSDENKAKRRELEQKWSFTEILKYLDSDEQSFVPIRGISAYLHFYGMQSHLVHSDNVALDLMHDQNTRQQQERVLKEISHVCRIMSDLCSFWVFSLEALQYSQSIPWNRRAVYWEEWKEFHDLSKHAKDDFFASQEDFYKHWKDN